MIQRASDDLFVRFYDFVRNNVCVPAALPPAATMYEINRPPLSKKFVFLDTVISGRAICEIIDGFSEAGLADFYIIAIIDENGGRLKPEYNRRLQELVSLDRATLIYMDRLFTEDRGPAVSGIWSVVFPELMQVALEEIPQFREKRAVGAGLYYWTEGTPDSPARAITLRRQAILGSMIVPSHSFLPQVLDEYVNELRKEKLFDPSTTVDIAHPRLAAAVKYPHKLEASGSHVVRVHLDRDIAAKIVREFLSSLSVRN